MDDQSSSKEAIMQMATTIVSSHVANNKVDAAELPSLISSVYDTLAGLSEKPTAVTERPKPAVPIKKSIQPDHIVCLEDGKKLKMLKRHLMSHYNMTPEQYRERWGLPLDYPMVAPDYADKRRFLAKKIGLGHGNRK
ncbi:MAG: MucR family transcriptional regulator [Kordiimonas sp.]